LAALAAVTDSEAAASAVATGSAAAATVVGTGDDDRASPPRRERGRVSVETLE
jgi:hypothetical protein